MASNGTNYIKRENGVSTFEIDTAGIEVLNYLKELVVSGAARTTEQNGGYSSAQDLADFMSGTIGFQIIQFQLTWQAGGLKEMSAPYGVLSVPMGPSVTDYHHVTTSYAIYCMYAQPNKDNAKKIADFMYVYTVSLYESDEDEYQAYWDEANNRIFDDGSAYFLEQIYAQNNIMKQNNYMYTWGGLANLFNAEPVIGGSKTAHQLAEEVTPICQDFINRIYE